MLHPPTLQCSHRFLMALRTFIPRVCTFWNTATPLCTAGATAPALSAVLLVARAAWDRQRVWRAGRVAGRAARERARIEVASDLVADAAVRDRVGKLAMLGVCAVGPDGGRWNGGLRWPLVVVGVVVGGRRSGIGRN